MKLSLIQLKEIVENFINEEDWLGDEEDIPLPLSLEEKIKNVFDKAKDIVINELKNSEAASQGIDNIVIKETIEAINKIYLHITSKSSQDKKGIKALAYHATYGDKEGKNRDVLHFDNIPEDIDLPKEIRAKYNSDPDNNPVIVIFKLYAMQNKGSIKELEDLLLHEVGHIKNSIIKVLSEKYGKGPKNKLNVEEVKTVLRKDIAKGTRNQVYEYILTRDGRIKNNTTTQSLVYRLALYYTGIYENPPDNLGVEEFSVRISALKRYPQALEDFKSGKHEYDYFLKNFNSDIADLVLFLDKDNPPKLSDVNKIVKSDEKHQKSVTV